MLPGTDLDAINKQVLTDTDLQQKSIILWLYGK